VAFSKLLLWKFVHGFPTSFPKKTCGIIRSREVDRFALMGWLGVLFVGGMWGFEGVSCRNSLVFGYAHVGASLNGFSALRLMIRPPGA